MKIETKKMLLFIVFLLCLALAAVVLFNLEDILTSEETGATNSAIDIKKEMETVYIDGEAYIPKKHVKNYLVIGVDEFGAAEAGGVAQADFLLVLSLDESTKSYTMLFINRDTMTEVDVYDIMGKKIEERVEQIALSHAYGSPFDISNSQKCINTQKAVSKLLFGVEFDGYISLTMSAVGEVVEWIGGVDVFIEEDMTEIDERLVAGETVLFDADLAMSYIRTRGALSDSSNISRMERQKDFLEAFIQKIGDFDPDEESLLSFYNNISMYIVSNMGIEMIDGMTEKIESYTGKMITLEGEAELGEKYMEFFVDEQARNDMLKEIFYEKLD